MKICALLSLFILVFSFTEASALEVVKTDKELVTYQVENFQYKNPNALSIIMQQVALEDLYSKTAEEDGVTYENCLHAGDKVYKVESVLGKLKCSQMPNGFDCNPKITMDINLLCEVTYYK